MTENECSVCYEKLGSVLDCHVVCENCVTKHFKQECPVCRKKHTLPVLGEPPKSQISLFQAKDAKPHSLAEIYAAMRKIQREKERDEIQDEDNVEEDNEIDVLDNDSEEYDYDL